MKRRIFGIILILAGIVIFCVPIGWQLHTKYQQKQMMDYFKRQIAENSNMSSQGDLINEFEEDQNPEEEYNKLELIDSENSGDSKSSEDNSKDNKESKEDIVKDILKYQKIVGIIEIKKIKITFAIVEGTERDNIRAAIGHMKGTADIGQEGNCVLAGHRGGIYGTFFKNIHKLDNGDKVTLTDENGNVYTYEVYDSFVVEPTEMSVIEDTKEGKILTLISCENNGTKRLIVKCKLE